MKYLRKILKVRKKYRNLYKNVEAYLLSYINNLCLD